MKKKEKKSKTCHKAKRTNTDRKSSGGRVLLAFPKKWIFKLLNKNMPRALVSVYL